jgi:TPR repeat protein
MRKSVTVIVAVLVCVTVGWRVWLYVSEQRSPKVQREKGLASLAQRDYVKASQCFRKAAEAGDRQAQLQLASMYQEGQGVPKDGSAALKWYRAAAEQGDPQAQTVLALAYSKGDGVAQDYAEAARWYRKAAEQGIGKAQLELGAMYAEGEGLQRDPAEAAKWLRKAAEQGLAYAQCALGILLEAGRGVAKDHGEAAKWYRKAADQETPTCAMGLANERLGRFTIEKGVLIGGYNKRLEVGVQKGFSEGGQGVSFNLPEGNILLGDYEDLVRR